MFTKIKHLATIVLTTFLVACGGGGETQLLVVFNGTVTGLGSGESLTLIGSLPTTLQSTTINVSANGPFSGSITLPSGFNFTTAGKATAVIGTKPVGKTCIVSFVTTTDITVACSSSTTAAGFYVGTLGITNGNAQMLILNDGAYWMWIGTSDGTTTSIFGLIQSNAGSWTSTGYTSTAGVDLFSNPQITNVGVAATYIAGTSLTGALSEGTASYSLALTVPSAVAYRYSDTPTLSKISGSYSLNNGILSVAATGNLTGQMSSGCTFAGTATPRTTGENAYNISITYGAAPCTSPNLQTSGIALLKTTTLGTQMLGAVTNSSKTLGEKFVGTKQ